MSKTVLDLYKDIVIDALVKCNAKLRKSFKTAFIQAMILYMVIPRKINFSQMGRYSDSCEQRFRQLFEREFDWLGFNISLMDSRFEKDSRKAIAIDASFITKSGKKTPYIGKFWSGCDSRAKRGLEILGISVIDIDAHDCIMLRAEQTPTWDDAQDHTLTEWYLSMLDKHKDGLLPISRHVVADAWFSKEPFVSGLCRMGFHIVSRLRDDAALWYANDQPRTGKRGRPRIKGERVDWGNLDKSKCHEISVDKGQAFGFKAYSRSLKRIIRVVVWFDDKGSKKIYFSTDTSLAYSDIVEYYRTRFQIEFCFHDAKQFTGLTHCQARDVRKLDFAFNASLSAVNIAKVVRYQHYPPLSIGLLKSYMSEVYLLKRIFARFGKSPNITFNVKLVNELFGYLADAS